MSFSDFRGGHLLFLAQGSLLIVFRLLFPLRPRDLASAFFPSPASKVFAVFNSEFSSHPVLCIVMTIHFSSVMLCIGQIRTTDARLAALTQSALIDIVCWQQEYLLFEVFG